MARAVRALPSGFVMLAHWLHNQCLFGKISRSYRVTTVRGLSHRVSFGLSCPVRRQSASARVFGHVHTFRAVQGLFCPILRHLKKGGACGACLTHYTDKSAVWQGEAPYIPHVFAVFWAVKGGASCSCSVHLYASSNASCMLVALLLAYPFFWP